MKVYLLILPLLLMNPCIGAIAQATNECPNSTVEDARGAKVATQAKAFLATLQAAVQSNDAKQFAALVHYPVLVISGPHTTKIATPSELIRRYPSLMTAKLKQTILDQSPRCLFGNYQGMMIGSGEIWFDQDSSGAMKIITINPTATDSSQTSLLFLLTTAGCPTQA